MKLNLADIAAQTIRFLTSANSPMPAESGQGIVICAGGIRDNTCAWVLIRLLRRLGCKLPIEVWYLGEAECSRDWMELMAPYDIQFVDAEQVRKEHSHPRLEGWALKRIGRTYEVRGMIEKVSSYDNATVGSGSVKNEVQLTYNDFSQLAREYQGKGVIPG
jgi:hypothetical protein